MEVVLIVTLRPHMSEMGYLCLPESGIHLQIALRAGAAEGMSIAESTVQLINTDKMFGIIQKCISILGKFGVLFHLAAELFRVYRISKNDCDYVITLQKYKIIGDFIRIESVTNK